MKVQVRLFARYREEAGRDHLDLELADGGTVERAWEAVTRQYPVLVPYRPYTLFALRNDYVGADHLLGDGDELCLFPPVSGGAAEPGPDWIEVTTEPLSERAVMDAVSDPAAGAVVLFSGVVVIRRGDGASLLEYEAHTPMAESRCGKSPPRCAAGGRDPGRHDPSHRTARDRRVERDDRGLVAHRRQAFESRPVRHRHAEGGNGARPEEGVLR
jgi:molybdopterin converting factor small subunit